MREIHEFEIPAPTILAERRCGNTTRQIDEEVQYLFQTGEACYLDHWEYGNHQGANKNHLHRLLRRLYYEHRITKDDIIIDKKRHIIKLKNFNQ